MRKAVNCAVLHDKLPKVVTSKCILFNCHPYDRKWEYKECLDLKADLLQDFETEDEFYKEIRGTEEYHNLIAELK